MRDAEKVHKRRFKSISGHITIYFIKIYEYRISNMNNCDDLRNILYDSKVSAIVCSSFMR